MYTTKDEIKQALTIAEQKIGRTASTLEKCASAHKAAKSDYDAAMAELLEITREIVTPNLFNQELAEKKPVDVDAWKLVELRSIPGISGKVADLLEENEPPIKTLGDYSEWSRPFSDIKGIGPAKAEELESAIEQFWKDHPEFTLKEDPKEPEEADNSSWRDKKFFDILPVVTREMLSKQLVILEDHDPPLATLGQWADYSAAQGGANFSDITGISTAHEKKIIAAIESWFDLNADTVGSIADFYVACGW